MPKEVTKSEVQEKISEIEQTLEDISSDVQTGEFDAVERNELMAFLNGIHTQIQNKSKT